MQTPLDTTVSRCQWDQDLLDASISSMGCYKIQAHVSAAVTDAGPQRTALVVQNTTEHVLQQLSVDTTRELSPVVSEDEGLSRMLA